MFARIRYAIRSRTVHAVLGAIAGAHLAVALSIAGVASAVMPAPVEAQTTATTCFYRNECLQPGTAANCDDTHCFEEGRGCPANQGACYVNPPAVPLQIEIGGRTAVLDLGDYIAVFYSFALTVAGTIAGVMLVVAGYQYLMSRGSADKVKAAQERIRGALVGLAILFGSYVILNTVNPDTLKLELPKIEVTRRAVFASCAATELCAPCGVEYAVLTRRSDGKTAESSADCGELTRLTSELNDAVLSQYEVVTQCVGRGCGRADVPGGSTACTDGQFRCRRGAGDMPFACGAKPAAAQEGYACQRCVSDGGECGAEGPNDSCCGGYCADGPTGNFCASGEPGDECDSGRECKSGICNTGIFEGSCVTGAVGSPCNNGSECKEGLVCGQAMRGGISKICTTAGAYSACDPAASTCTAGTRCVAVRNLNLCVPEGQSTESCSTNADCNGKGGYCSTFPEKNICTDGRVGAVCYANEQCASGRCAKGSWVCTDGANGSVCDENSDCASGKCYTNGNYGVCTSGGRGAKCDAGGDDCNSGLRCSADGRCVTIEG